MSSSFVRVGCDFTTHQVDKVHEARMRNQIAERLSRHLGITLESKDVDRLVQLENIAVAALHALDEQELLGVYQKHNGGKQ